MTNPSVDEIAKEVCERYSSFNTYADRGRYESVSNPDKPPAQRRYRVLHFETRFRRPDAFYFEYREEAPGPRQSWRGITIWRLGGVCRVWPGLSGDTEEISLDRALAGATGVSRRTAIEIPSLLLPTELRAHALTRPEQCERLDDMVIDDRPHWCVGQRPESARGEPDRYIIDPDTFLIRRIEGAHFIDAAASERILDLLRDRMPPDLPGISEKYREQLQKRLSREFGPHRSTNTTDYTASIDPALDDSAFQFQPLS